MLYMVSFFHVLLVHSKNDFESEGDTFSASECCVPLLRSFWHEAKHRTLAVSKQTGRIRLQLIRKSFVSDNFLMSNILNGEKVSH